MEAKFHLALPCDDLEATKDFYLNVLEARLGRQAKNWVDIDLFGNQLTFFVQDFTYPACKSDYFGQVLLFHPHLFHTEFNGLYGVGHSDRIMFVLQLPLLDKSVLILLLIRYFQGF